MKTGKPMLRVLTRDELILRLQAFPPGVRVGTVATYSDATEELTVATIYGKEGTNELQGGDSSGTTG